MANELKHGSVGTELTQTEWEGIGTHVIANQAVGDIIYASTTSQLRRLAKGTDTHVLILSSGVPAWSATTGITTVGTIATGVWQGTDVGVAYGGTGVSTLTANGVLIGNGASAITSVDMSTKGHVLIGDGSGNPQMLGVGTNTHVLTADSGETTGVKWAAPAAAAAGSLTGSTLASGVTASSLTSVGTVTSGVWNAGAVTASGDITASATGDRYLLVHSTNASIAGIELRRATTGDGNFDWFWEASGGKLLASFKGSGSKTLAWGLETNGDASFESHDALNIGAAGNDFGAACLDLASGYEIAGAGGLTISSASGNLDIESAGDTIRLRLGGADKVILATSGLRMTSDTPHGTTAGTNVLSIFNGTPPAGTMGNGASFFCAAGEMKVIDAAGNVTVLSPHDDDGRWIFDSRDSVTGRGLRIQMEQMMRRLDEMLGGGYIEEFTEEIGA